VYLLFVACTNPNRQRQLPASSIVCAGTRQPDAAHWRLSPGRRWTVSQFLNYCLPTHANKLLECVACSTGWVAYMVFEPVAPTPSSAKMARRPSVIWRAGRLSLSLSAALATRALLHPSLQLSCFNCPLPHPS
jgi:hypothetical protein